MSGKIKKALILFIFMPSLLYAEDFYETALQKYQSGDYVSAKKILLKKSSLNAGDYNLLGWIYLRLRDTSNAKKAFEKSLSLNPEIHDSLCGLGYAYYFKGDFKNALEYFQLGIEKDKNLTDCINGISSLKKIYTSENKGSERRSFFAKGNYFWVEKKGKIDLFFIKGVNIGFGLPGKFPTEFPDDESFYKQWLESISEMEANTVRVYTILPPEFYRALKRFNEQSEKKLFLIQGIWVELPEHGSFREPHYMEEVKKEIRNAVDLIHGKAVIEPRFGHASGNYNADVSDYVLAFIFGREWEPYEVRRYNELNPPGSYIGRFLGINNGNAFEVWLTELLDYLITYEEEIWNTQRPVAPMNWPTLDPLYHRSEASFAEEVEFRNRIGEKINIKDLDLSSVYDDDVVSIDETKIIQLPAFRAGLFISYHVYPYYPDFLRNEEKYGYPSLSDGSSLYFNYLKDLKSYYRELPLLISEFGLSTSRGIARFHPEGLNHGGLTEEEQAEGLKRLYTAITHSNAAGGIVFSWIDEWFKTNWMVKDKEERNQMWFNAEDPEESFGLIAMQPKGVEEKLRGNPEAWKKATVLYSKGKTLRSLGDGFDDARNIKRIIADYDAGYLYLRMDIEGKIDWDRVAYLIAIDTYGDREGDHLIPFIQMESPIGFEFILLIHGDKSRILIDDKYADTIFNSAIAGKNGLCGYVKKSKFGLEENRNGIFTEIVTIHRRRFSRDGSIFPERIYNASKLRHGRLDENNLSDFYYSKDNNFIEIRIPYNLLNIVDPSKRIILYRQKETKPTEGIRIMGVSYRPISKNNSNVVVIDGIKNITEIIPHDMNLRYFRWQWENPEFITRPKKAYYSMKELFKKTTDPKIDIYIPDGFNFTESVKKHYKSIDEFLKHYEEGISNKGSFGTGLSKLILGLLKNEPFYLLEARTIFLYYSKMGSGRIKTLSDYSIRYIDSLITGFIKRHKSDLHKVVPVNVKKKPARAYFKRIIIGKSFIKLSKGSKIKTQVDRVTRDWLSGVGIENDPWNLQFNELVKWHEGARVKEIINYTGSKVKPVWGTLVKRFKDGWYALDEEGNFRFRISEDKIFSYPTNIIVDDETVFINDTHGINSIAWDSLDADLVIGCGDHEGKVDAAYYLASKGINVYMPTDRFISLLIGADTKGMIIGSAPVKPYEDGALIGNQPISIDIEEPVVVSYSRGGYPVSYYDTPYRYFKELEAYINKPLKITPVEINEYGKAALVVERAREINAKVIGIRVSTKEEHDTLFSWLKENTSHRAILFHTATYEEGYRLFFEFPAQTGFGDINIYLE